MDTSNTIRQQHSITQSWNIRRSKRFQQELFCPFLQAPVPNKYEQIFQFSPSKVWKCLAILYFVLWVWISGTPMWCYILKAKAVLNKRGSHHKIEHMSKNVTVHWSGRRGMLNGTVGHNPIEVVFFKIYYWREWHLSWRVHIIIIWSPWRSFWDLVEGLTSCTLNISHVEFNKLTSHFPIHLPLNKSGNLAFSM